MIFKANKFITKINLNLFLLNLNDKISITDFPFQQYIQLMKI